MADDKMLSEHDFGRMLARLMIAEADPDGEASLAIALHDQAQRTRVRELVTACDEYENSGYSGGFHEAKTAARSVLGESR